MEQSKQLYGNNPVLMLTGPMGGDKDVIRYPQPKFNFGTPWTSQISEATVKRFVGEAKYFLQIYNVVVQHFVYILPFRKYFEEGSDAGAKKKKRDSLYALLWGAVTLEEMLNPQSDEACAFMPEDEERHEINLAVESSFQSVRELVASSSSVKEDENILEAESLQSLMEPEASCTPSLISKMKDRFNAHLDAEIDELKKKLEVTLPEYAEKNVNQINKLVMKTTDYSDYIADVEMELHNVKWPAYHGNKLKYLDLRENYKEIYHALYAPAYIVHYLESICLYAYILLKKIKELEKVMEKKDPNEYAKLQESKEKILFPLVHIDKLMVSS